VIPSRVTYHVLPFVLGAAFVLIASLPDGNAGLGVVAFGLAGLGCSALLPLTISFGPLLDAGVGLHSIYGFAAAIAVAIGAWSFAVARRRPSPASLHPAPESR
jgi:hypothetical protein